MIRFQTATIFRESEISIASSWVVLRKGRALLEQLIRHLKRKQSTVTDYALLGGELQYNNEPGQRDYKRNYK